MLSLSAAGLPEKVVLHAPYGASRYGASHLYTVGFTGQRQDDTTRPAYLHAPYYDPVVGQSSARIRQGKGSTATAMWQAPPRRRPIRAGTPWRISSSRATAPPSPRRRPRALAAAVEEFMRPRNRFGTRRP